MPQNFPNLTDGIDSLLDEEDDQEEFECRFDVFGVPMSARIYRHESYGRNEGGLIADGGDDPLFGELTGSRRVRRVEENHRIQNTTGSTSTTASTDDYTITPTFDVVNRESPEFAQEPEPTVKLKADLYLGDFDEQLAEGVAFYSDSGISLPNGMTKEGKFIKKVCSIVDREILRGGHEIQGRAFTTY